MFASNILSLASGVMVGFLVPKMMGLTDYANYKIYTLYLTYLSLLSLGFGDGLYLKYAGKAKEDLDFNQLRYYARLYYMQLGLCSVVGLLISLLLLPKQFVFIGIALSIAIMSANIVSLHQNFSLITLRFNEYSLRTIIKAALTAIYVLTLFLIYCFCDYEVAYQIYIFGVLAIEIILAGWYFFSYKDINLGKVDKKKINEECTYRNILLLGFPLLLSNMAGTIFLNLDRQFVSVLFEREQYAVYAFAYNMLTLVTTMTSAVSLVLFPSMRRKGNIDVKASIEKFSEMFGMVVCFCLMIYFPLYYFVNAFLPKYTLSMEIFRIVLPGIALSTTVSVIFINFYKLENKVKIYFALTMVSMVASAVLNYVAYVAFHTYQSISWASIISLICWYLLTSGYFVLRYEVSITRNLIYYILIGTIFYAITSLTCPVWVAGVIYLVSFVVITILVNRKTVRNIIDNIGK